MKLQWGPIVVQAGANARRAKQKNPVVAHVLAALVRVLSRLQGRRDDRSQTLKTPALPMDERERTRSLGRSRALSRRSQATAVVYGVCVGALVMFADRGLAQEPTPSFSIPGLAPISPVAVQGNGQILAATSTPSSLVRFNPDGTLDPSLTNTLHGVDAIGTQTDGKIWISGLSGVERIDADGGGAVSFRSYGSFNSFGTFAIQPDGKILIPSPWGLARFNANGTTDTTFVCSVPGIPQKSVVVEPDGKILLCQGIAPELQRLNPDGSLDSDFHYPETVTALTTVVPQADGKTLIAGYIPSDGESLALTRLNADGSFDSLFKSPARLSPMLGMALQTDGKIVIAAGTASTSGQRVATLMRLNSDGTVDSSFPSLTLMSALAGGGLPQSMAVALKADGTILVAANGNLMQVANPEPATQSLALDGTTLTWLRGGSSPQILQARFQYSSDGKVWTDLGVGQRIAGGWRLQGVNVPEGASIRGRGIVSGTSWSVETVVGPPVILTQPLDLSLDAGSTAVFRVFADGDGPLSYQWMKQDQFLDPGFPVWGGNKPTLTIPDVNWADAGDYYVQVSNRSGVVTSRTAHLSVRDPVILGQSGDQSLSAGDTLRLNVEAKGTSLTYQWLQNGLPIAGATSPSLVVTNASPQQTGNYIVVVAGARGVLTSAAISVHVNAVLRDSWNPQFAATTQWYPLQSAAVLPDGSCLIGGLFRTLTVPARTNLVKFDANGDVDPTFAPSLTGPDPVGVDAIAVQEDGRILVGGSFAEVSGVDRTCLARLEPDGTLDSSFNPVITGTRTVAWPQVTGLVFQPDGRLLVAGAFSSVDGVTVPGLARLLPDGSLDSSFHPTEEDVPFSISSMVLQPDGKVIVFGQGLCRLNSDGTPDPTFHPAVNSSSSVILQADGKLLVDGPKRLNPDGTLDDTFPPPLTYDSIKGLETNGRLLVSDTLASMTYVLGSVLLAVNPDGTEDPGVSVTFDNYFSIMAQQEDGTLLVAGKFFTDSGPPIPQIVRFHHPSSTPDTLTFSGNSATWLRGDTSPEVWRTQFEFSSDGTNWTNLGAGIRIPGGWRLDGIHLSSVGTLRVRGYLGGSIYEKGLSIPLLILPQATSLEPNSGESIVTCLAVPGSQVALETSPDLVHWTVSEVKTSGTQPVQFNVPNQGATAAFYRLKLVPQ